MKAERTFHFDLPIRTLSTNHGNGREHWAARSRRTKKERQAAWMLTPRNVHLPVTVYLIRHSAGKLDDDNLRGALKAVRDGIADALHVDDGSDVVTWLYRQESAKRGTHRVEIAILEGKVEKYPDSGYNHPYMPQNQI